MTCVTLSSVLEPALAQGYAVPGLVCLGWEDMRAYVAAAEAVRAPVILQAGPSCRAHTPLPVLSKMMRHLAEATDVPVALHLDHGRSKEECVAAIEAGFTSVMFDGSDLPLAENIAKTSEIVALAHAQNVSCEGEIGFVGYAQGTASQATDPDEAAQFAQETQVDALAVSVGNVHLQKTAGNGLDEAAIAAIEARCATPLVIHGGSGVPDAQRAALAAGSRICKFNIGTELRQVFGQVLRQELSENPELFDRVDLLKRVEAPIQHAAEHVCKVMGAAGRA